jgi:hypothetical protein
MNDNSILGGLSSGLKVLDSLEYSIKPLSADNGGYGYVRVTFDAPFAEMYFDFSVEQAEQFLGEFNSALDEARDRRREAGARFDPPEGENAD